MYDMVHKDFSLEGKVALLVEEGQSWLQSLASSLAEAGADIVIASRNRKEIKKAANTIKNMGRKILTIPFNLTSYKQVEKMVTAIIDQWGKIDILVNIIDLQFAKPLIEITNEEWNRVMKTNLTIPFNCTKAVGRHMLERKEGKIITITSCLAERGLPNCTAYCASKGGVVQFTRSLALEWARQNIRVNAIGVGWTSDNDRQGIVDDRLIRFIPLRRLCQIGDIGPLLVYLASDASSYVTGQTYFISGGVMAHG